MTLKDKDRLWCVSDQSVVFEIELIEDRTFWFDEDSNDCDPGKGTKHINFKTKLIGPKTWHTEAVHRAHFFQVWHDDLNTYKMLCRTKQEAVTKAIELAKAEVAKRERELELAKERLQKLLD